MVLQQWWLLLVLRVMVGRVRTHSTDEMTLARMVVAAAVPRAIAVHHSCHDGWSTISIFIFFFLLFK